MSAFKLQKKEQKECKKTLKKLQKRLLAFSEFSCSCAFNAEIAAIWIYTHVYMDLKYPYQTFSVHFLKPYRICIRKPRNRKWTRYPKLRRQSLLDADIREEIRDLKKRQQSYNMETTGQQKKLACIYFSTFWKSLKSAITCVNLKKKLVRPAVLNTIILKYFWAKTLVALSEICHRIAEWNLKALLQSLNFFMHTTIFCYFCKLMAFFCFRHLQLLCKWLFYGIYAKFRHAQCWMKIFWVGDKTTNRSWTRIGQLLDFGG